MARAVSQQAAGRRRRPGISNSGALSAISEYWGKACYKQQLSVPARPRLTFTVFIESSFSATRIGQLTLDNRIVIAPMCWGTPPTRVRRPPWHRIHLGQLAFSGAGLLILEATAACGAYSPGIWGCCGMMKPKTPCAARSRRYPGLVADPSGDPAGSAPDARHPAPPGREAISWRSTMVAGRPSPLPPAFHDGDAPR